MKVLRAQPTLSDERLTTVVALLKDETWNVRNASIKVLEAQPSLSYEILTVLSLLLDSKSAGGLAEVILRGYKEFYLTLLSGPSAGSVFKIFLS